MGLNFVAALAPVLLAAAVGGGGGSTAAASGSKKGGLSLAESFLMSTGALPFGDAKAVTPFTAPTPAVRARSLGQMDLGSRGSGQAGRLTPAQRMLASNVDVQTAAANMMANATNPQFRDFAQKYASPLIVQRVNDPKLTLDAPSDIDVKTASA
jgi:hypothetical protein